MADQFSSSNFKDWVHTAELTKTLSELFDVKTADFGQPALPAANQEFAVSDNRRIGFILRSLLAENASLSVTFKEGEIPSVTNVLDVDEEQGVFILSAFSLVGHQQLARAGRPFVLRGYDKGVEVIIENLNVLEDAGAYGHEGAYEVGFPSWLQYKQRRECFRVRVNSSTKVDISMFVKETGQHLPGQLVDISSDGCRVVFYGILEEPRRLKGWEIQLKIAFPGVEESLKIMARVVNQQMDEKTETLYIGFKYLRLASNTQKLIDEFVGKIQREACKKRVSD